MEINQMWLCLVCVSSFALHISADYGDCPEPKVVEDFDVYQMEINDTWLCLVCVCTFVLHAYAGYGNCPQPKVVDNFDVYRYGGKWFQHASQNIDDGDKCNFDIWIPDRQVSYSIYFPLICIRKNQNVTDNGFAYLKDVNVGKLFENIWTNKWWVNPTRPYWVLGTDYENYSVVYSCVPSYWLFHSSTLRVFTRKSNVTDSTVMNKIKTILEENNFKYSDLVKADCTNYKP